MSAKRLRAIGWIFEKSAATVFRCLYFYFAFNVFIASILFLLKCKDIFSFGDKKDVYRDRACDPFSSYCKFSLFSLKLHFTSLRHWKCALLLPHENHKQILERRFAGRTKMRSAIPKSELNDRKFSDAASSFSQDFAGGTIRVLLMLVVLRSARAKGRYVSRRSTRGRRLRLYVLEPD